MLRDQEPVAKEKAPNARRPADESSSARASIRVRGGEATAMRAAQGAFGESVRFAPLAPRRNSRCAVEAAEAAEQASRLEHPRPAFVRPMVGVETFKALTGCDEDELVVAIETGRIRWAFDFSTRRSRRKRFVRVWVRSIDCFRYPELYRQPGSLEGFFTHLFPRDTTPDDCLLGTTLQTLMNVSGDHLSDLIHAREMYSEYRALRTGPCGTPRVFRRSVEAFFRRRWIGQVSDHAQQ